MLCVSLGRQNCLSPPELSIFENIRDPWSRPVHPVFRPGYPAQMRGLWGGGRLDCLANGLHRAGRGLAIFGAWTLVVLLYALNNGLGAFH